MSDAQDLSTIAFAFKAQSAIDSPASGADAFGIDLLPSQGLQVQAQTIASALLKRNKMKKRSRRGSNATTAAYETELIKGVFEGLGPAVLGADDWTAEATLTEADLTSCTLSGTGTICTFGGGNVLSMGIVAGQFVKFTALSVSGNNAKWVPVLDAGLDGSHRVLHFPPGYLADNAVDSAFSITIARHVFTPTVYGTTVYSVEEYLDTIDRSKFAKNVRFNSLVFGESPTAYPKISFGVAGRALEMKVSGSSPVFTDPTYPSGESLILLDGGLFLNGTKRLDMTALTFGITAPVSTTAVIGTNDGPPAKIGDFEFSGSVTGVVEDGDTFDDWDGDEDVSLLAHYKDKQDETGIGVYAGNLGYASYGSPASGQGDQTQTLALYGGDDDRGAGYKPTTFLISDMT